LSKARSTISIARSTPAQNPRGFAKITFIDKRPDPWLHSAAPGGINRPEPSQPANVSYKPIMAFALRQSEHLRACRNVAMI
jgi:hypothetical protein